MTTAPAGQTGGLDLTVETLEFIYDNWEGVALTFDESSDGGFQYDTRQYDTAQYSSANAWARPVLRNSVSKTIYPDGETAGYTAQLRNNDVVTVGEPSISEDPTGTRFDFDVEAELDVTVQAMPGNGFSNVEDSTDWATLKAIVKRAFLTERRNPITDPDCKYDWRWLTVANGSPLPETTDNRNLQGYEFTARWHGYESLPSLP